MVWSLEYERQPRQASNPGFIAQSVRTLKTALSERLGREHFFGNLEGTTPGKHREGSARAFVNDDESAARDDKAVSDSAVGRLFIDLDVRSVVPKTNDVDVTGDALLVRDFLTWDKDGNEVVVFSPDDYVSSSQDQIITGRKRYIGENPQVTEDLSDPTYDAIVSTPERDRADNRAVKRSQIKVWSNDAKEHNIFNALDPDNTTMNTASGNLNPVSGNIQTTVNSISANEIYAERLYGAVYG